MVNFRFAAASVALAFAVVLWAYGAYCYIQMVRHRRPGVSGYTVFWPGDRLTERGRTYKGRALRIYGLVAVLLVVVYVLTRRSAA